MVSYNMPNEIKPDSPSAIMCRYGILLAEGGFKGSCDTLEKAREVAAQYKGAKVTDMKQHGKVVAEEVS